MALTMVLIAGAIGTASAFRSTAQELSRTRHLTAASTTRLRDLDQRRHAVDARLHVAQRLVAASFSELHAATAARQVSQARLVAARGSLAKSYRSALVSLQDERARSNELLTLQFCVDGMTNALNRAGVGDVAGAQRTLRGLQVRCAVVGVSA